MIYFDILLALLWNSIIMIIFIYIYGKLQDIYYKYTSRKGQKSI